MENAVAAEDKELNKAYNFVFMGMNSCLKIIVNSSGWNFILINFFLKKFLKLIDRKPTNALEVGCGIGATTKALITYFPNIRLTAIDYDLSQVEMAKKNLSKIKNIEVRQADATKLPFESEKFDTAFCFNTLHHIKNFKEALKEISRVLKPQGLLYLMDETKDFWNILFRWVDRPEVLFNHKDVINAALEYNLECQKFQGRKIFYSIFKKLEV